MCALRLRRERLYDLDRPDANPVFCVSKGMSGTLGPTWGDILGKVITSGSSTCSDRIEGGRAAW
jgi:hypothetical protein